MGAVTGKGALSSGPQNSGKTGKTLVQDKHQMVSLVQGAAWGRVTARGVTDAKLTTNEETPGGDGPTKQYRGHLMKG